jgi:hypothetical protein
MIFAQVQALADPSSAEPIMLSNDEVVLLRTSQDDRQSTRNVSFDMNSTVNVATLPLMVNITARAAFTKLLFKDIRVDCSDLLVALGAVTRNNLTLLAACGGVLGAVHAAHHGNLPLHHHFGVRVVEQRDGLYVAGTAMPRKPKVQGRLAQECC